HAHPAADQIGRQLRQPIITAFRPAVFDRHILTLDVAFFTEALPECGQVPYPKIYRDAVENADHRHRRLLRARRERPGPAAAEQRDDLAAYHGSLSPRITPYPTVVGKPRCASPQNWLPGRDGPENGSRRKVFRDYSLWLCILRVSPFPERAAKGEMEMN